MKKELIIKNLKIIYIKNKNKKGYDLIVIQKDKAKSMRSNTELINYLIKNNLSKEIDKVINWLKK